ncbi:MAG: ribulose-phosphate 3-epimerase [Christensenellales bacterium]|jgi:ribulose-phosphate 3-epimerase
MNKVLVSPSILSADFSRLGSEVASLEQAGADWIHVDVMDGNFVPNITFGPCVLAACRPHTDLPLDVHLMVDDAIRYIPAFAEAGADIITVHMEAERDVKKSVDLIHHYGLKAGVAISPNTPELILMNMLNQVELVLVMTVNPGFGGQKFMPEAAKKVQAIRRMQINPELRIGVDGGINLENVKSVIHDGADVIIAGSTVFNAKNKALAINALRRG